MIAFVVLALSVVGGVDSSLPISGQTARKLAWDKYMEALAAIKEQRLAEIREDEERERAAAIQIR